MTQEKPSRVIYLARLIFSRKITIECLERI